MNKDKLIESSNAFDKPTPSTQVGKKAGVITIGTLAVIACVGIGTLTDTRVNTNHTYESLNNDIKKAKADKNTNTDDIINLFDRIATYDTSCSNFHRMEKLDPSVANKQAKLMHKLDTGKQGLAKSGHELDIKTKKHGHKWQITIKEMSNC